MSKMDYVRAHAMAQAKKLAPGGKGLVAKHAINYVKSPVYRIGTDLAMGGSIGVAAAMFDGENDSVGSLAGKAVKSAGVDALLLYGAGMGARTYLRSQHFSNLVVSNALGGLSDTHKPMAQSLVNKGARKLVKPVSKGKLGMGGAGLAAGLLYSMINGTEDGVGGTMVNTMAAGGLALVGHDLLGSLSKGKSSDGTKAGPVSKFNKVRQSNMGGALESSIKDILNTDAGKGLQNEMTKIFNTPEGKALSSTYKSVTSGQWQDIMKGNALEMQSNVAKIQGSFDEFMSSKKGHDILRDVEKVVKEKGPQITREVQAAIAKDAAGSVADHVDGIKQKVTKFHHAYTNNADAIESVLKKVLPGEQVDSVGKFVKNGAENIINKLDTITATDITGTQTKNTQDIGKETSQTKADAESSKVAQNGEANSQVKVSDMEREKLKLESEQAMKDKSTKRIKGWGMKAKGLGVIGLGAFAVASVMDTSQGLQEKTATSRMTEEQEKNLKRKTSKEEKNQRQNAYGYTDMGGIVTEMWNNRIGHHKMGNSKFQ